MDKKYALGQKNNTGSQAAAATDAAATDAATDAANDADTKDDYTPEKGTCCFCIPTPKPPGKKGHGTAAYVTNLLVPMNVPMKDYPPGFNMTKEGGKHNLEITENRLKFITLKAPVNETLDRADVERVAQAV